MSLQYVGLNEYHQQHEGEHRSLSGRRYHRRISLRQRRTGIPDRLWQSGFQAGLGTDVYCHFVHYSYRSLRPVEFD